eukprot:TRINITY_DN347_c0_g2_i1.p1 TRINITY_DN347_c0_g2~~TRINITY_DN347_c0_g2_i1.p1  ORF type:complete len:420 (+),score=50.43 TRINITY_DN347_c0_g2_i1:155-1414(+)
MAGLVLRSQAVDVVATRSKYAYAYQPFSSKVNSNSSKTFYSLRFRNRANLNLLTNSRRSAPQRLNRSRRVSCAARTTSKVSIPSHGYDYYDLLGVDPRASSAEIKQSYRWLQKRCHPDVSGEVGHDMALLLNEAYGVLSDLSARITYDQLRVTWVEDGAFSGKTLWSTWLGPPEEDKAVFVDEAQCVGCLKCALIAGNTFAIENRHGRARAVWQWGDDEDVVDDAIEACPVDCIRWVERSKLAALEHMMARQPRMTAGLMQHSGDKAGRNASVFDEAERFLEKRAKREEAREAAQPAASQDRERNASAAATIRAKSGRWWQTSTAAPSSFSSATWTAAQKSQGSLIPLDWVTSPAEAAAARANSAFAKGGAFIAEELRNLRDAARRQGWRSFIGHGKRRGGILEANGAHFLPGVLRRQR